MEGQIRSLVLFSTERIVGRIAPAGGDGIAQLLRQGGEEVAVAGEWERDALAALGVGVGGAGLEEFDEGGAGGGGNVGAD